MKLDFSTSESFNQSIEQLVITGCAHAGMRWAIQLAFNSGIARGMTHENGRVHPYDWFEPHFDRFHFHFYRTVGSAIYCELLPLDDNGLFHQFDSGDGRLLDMQLFQSNATTPDDIVVLGCAAFEQVVTTLLPESKFDNHIAFCESPHSGMVARFCENIGGHMVCSECQDRYMLCASNPLPSKEDKDPRKIERAKMTPSLRYSILLRDKFTCKGCGRSPNKGDEVKLHVDHIVAIALGGKTVPENLQTLCDDCNLGKGTSPWVDDPQLSMF